MSPPLPFGDEIYVSFVHLSLQGKRWHYKVAPNSVVGMRRHTCLEERELGEYLAAKSLNTVSHSAWGCLRSKSCLCKNGLQG